VYDTGTGTTGYAVFYAQSNSGNGQLFKTGSGYAGLKTIQANDLGFINNTSGNISILNNFATGNINFAAGASATAHLTISSAGNFDFAAGNLTTTGSLDCGTFTSNITAATNLATIKTTTSGLAVLVIDRAGGSATHFATGTSSGFRIGYADDAGGGILTIMRGAKAAVTPGTSSGMSAVAQFDSTGNFIMDGGGNITTTGIVTGKLVPTTAASDPQDATPGNRPAGTLYQIIAYSGKLYFCTNAATPTWELITSS
jgi:hypothetical protein